MAMAAHNAVYTAHIRCKSSGWYHVCSHKNSQQSDCCILRVGKSSCMLAGTSNFVTSAFILCLLELRSWVNSLSTSATHPTVEFDNMAAREVGVYSPGGSSSCCKNDKTDTSNTLSLHVKVATDHRDHQSSGRNCSEWTGEKEKLLCTWRGGVHPLLHRSTPATNYQNIISPNNFCVHYL